MSLSGSSNEGIEESGIHEVDSSKNYEGVIAV